MEVKIFERLGRHPHLVKLLAVSTMSPNGNQCMVLELAQRGSLDSVLQELHQDGREKPSHSVLLTAACQVCACLACVYEYSQAVRQKQLNRYMYSAYVGINIHIYLQICEAMEILTQYNIIHRDLAARNVLVFSFHPRIRQHVLVKVCTRSLHMFACAFHLTTRPLQGVHAHTCAFVPSCVN